MQLRHAARTDVGKTRDHNEDSYGIELGAEHEQAGALFVVCDGIGGFASGEVASDLAVKTIISRFYGGDNRDAAAALTRAMEATNQLVFQEGGGKMGTTSVAALFRDDAVTIANVGDCRAYVIRGGKPRQITRDHSFVAEQVRQGNMTEQQARESSYRNIITRAIGHRPEVEVDTFREPLLKDDIFVLCSDGLHGQVTVDEITLAVTKVPLDDACNRLVKLANDRGGPDNITIVAIQVAELAFRTETVAESPTAPLAAASTDRIAKSASVPSEGASATTARLDSVYGPPPAIERRKADRRSPPPPSSPIRSASTANPLRSLLLYATVALLLAALIFGAYYFFVLGPGSGTALPQTSTAPRPALTPLGGPTETPIAPTATLVATTTAVSP